VSLRALNLLLSSREGDAGGLLEGATVCEIWGQKLKLFPIKPEENENGRGPLVAECEAKER
jgi:hypothetical protein